VNQHWESAGTGRGRVVLLHGMMSTAATWWRIGPALAERGWVVDALDLPGHGEWPRSERPLDLDMLADGIAGRLGGPVDLLVGHSMGGAVAVALAGRRPGAARAVVLEDPLGPLGEAARVALADGVEVAARLVRRDDRAQLVRREREANPTWAAEDVEHSLDGIAAADWQAMAAGLRGELAWDLPAMVAAVRAPLLVMAARGDRGLDAGGSSLQSPDREAVRAQLPPDRFVILDGGHCLHRDLPDRWLAVVGGFADAVLAPAS
jgi:pimeloyl-ACP methyl ester carboxylesterase